LASASRANDEYKRSHARAKLNFRYELGIRQPPDRRFPFSPLVAASIRQIHPEYLGIESIDRRGTAKLQIPIANQPFK
jgi:hypothetical protein